MYHSRTVSRVSLLLMVANLGLAAACSAPAAAPTTAPTGGDGAVPAQPKVNRLIVADERVGLESNNVRTICCLDAPQLRPMYENLIGTDPATGKYQPQLATEWKLEDNAGARSVRFKLRQGVNFHGDWGEMTADDVLHTFTEYTTKSDSNAWWTWWRDIVKKVEVVGPYEVVFQVNPHATWLNAIAEQYQQLPIQSKKEFAAKGDPSNMSQPPHPGTGPYQYVTREQANFIRFKRVDYKHWRTTPDFPEMEIRYIKEASTRLAGVLTEEIHVTKLPADLEPQAARSGMKLVANRVKGPRIFGHFWCCQYAEDGSWPLNAQSPMMNLKVRQALNKAVDKDGLRKAFAPDAEPMYNIHYRPEWGGWNPAWQSRFQDYYGYDIPKAKALLAEAGYGPNNPLTTNILVTDLQHHSSGRDMAEAIAASWRSAGINVNLITLDVATQTQQRNALKFENHLVLNSTASDQVYAMEAYETAGMRLRYQGTPDPEIVNIYQNQLLKQMEPEKQEPYLRQLGDLAYDKVWGIPLMYLDVRMVINPRIVADYVFPSNGMHGTFTHLDVIKAAK